MRSIAPVTVVATILLLSLWVPNYAIAGGAEPQVCDVGADYSLGVEDYSEAVRRHVEIVRKFPHNALAHYHLGFAHGMVGNRAADVKEYTRAEGLGLRSWDLFLNLGLAELEIGDPKEAMDSLRQAVLLGGEHSESHFNLGLADEQRGMLADAEYETLVSLRLNPAQPDARNLLGVIYAQEGKTASASLVWRELVREVPDYEPASTNLAILGRPSEAPTDETAAFDLPRAAAVNAIPAERELRLTAGEAQFNPSPTRYNGR